MKHCPMLDCLNLTTTEIRKPEFLDTLFLLYPSLSTLIFKEQSTEYASFDLAFLSTLKLLHVRVFAPVLSIDFLRKCFKFSRYLIGLNYVQPNFGPNGLDLSIFKLGACFQVASNLGIQTRTRTIEDAIEFLRRNDLINRLIK